LEGKEPITLNLSEKKPYRVPDVVVKALDEVLMNFNIQVPATTGYLRGWHKYEVYRALIKAIQIGVAQYNEVFFAEGKAGWQPPA